MKDDNATGDTPLTPTWREALMAQQPLLLPIAHDALSAKLIERAGFKAYAIGGFAVVGARHALPDLGLAGLGEMVSAVDDIVEACSLPVLVDIDDGYGDVKNVVRTVQMYERRGVACMQLEDQVSPKRCGHMAGKAIVSTSDMVSKIRAAASAREDSETFIVARTDARAIEGLDGALRRAEQYLEAGADGLFIEAPQSLEELATIGRAFVGVPLVVNMLEGGQTPLLTAAELCELGFAMIGYPTSLIFRVIRTIENALAQLALGLIPTDEPMTFSAYKELIGVSRWAEIEERSRPN